MNRISWNHPNKKITDAILAITCLAKWFLAISKWTLLSHTFLLFMWINMSHFSYACKMRYPLNLVLENWEYLWSYLAFCIVILDYGLKLHKLLIHTLVILQKWLEIYKFIVWSLHCILFSAIFATEKFMKTISVRSSKLNYSSPRLQISVPKANALSLLLILEISNRFTQFERK